MLVCWSACRPQEGLFGLREWEDEGFVPDPVPGIPPPSEIIERRPRSEGPRVRSLHHVSHHRLTPEIWAVQDNFTCMNCIHCSCIHSSFCFYIYCHIYCILKLVCSHTLPLLEGTAFD